MSSEALIAINKTEEHVVCMCDMRNAYQIFLRISKRTDQWEAMTIR